MTRTYAGAPGFSNPFTTHNIAGFTVRPDGDGTRMTWSMEGPSPLITRVVGLFFDMDKLIGGEFEAGLANLKAVAQK